MRAATVAAITTALLAGCSSSADLDNHSQASTPTQDRLARPALVDNPATTNDESNDQPLRTAGTHTLCVTNQSNGHEYTLDADMDDDNSVTTIYFPKGGNVDFTGCELEDDQTGDCDDDEGHSWTFDGEC